MPLGYERLNERSQRPNSHINFIKPLTSSSDEDQKIAQDFLERIAAQCYPIMKKEYISVMALEEYPPNSEFIGRNFNAGEVIQLVLKDKSGRWLSFKFVQMVMMHELAHCKQMNHSRYFWQVRNQYADQMKGLWAKKYEGEGVWGRGQNLTSGQFVHDHMPDNADIPEHLCGGTYRRGRGGGRKRKRGGNDSGQPKQSYAERQQKRIAKKFGAHGDGHGLGEDELVRGGLEQGKRSSGKPRVAQSKRGRELRANAALARFDAAKKEQQQQKPLEKTPELVLDDDSETESSADDFADGLNLLNTLEKIKDQRGRDLYKVCGDEGEQNEGGNQELDELRSIGGNQAKPNTHSGTGSGSKAARKTDTISLHADSETESEQEADDPPGAGSNANLNGPNVTPSQDRPKMSTGATDRTHEATATADNSHTIPEHADNITTCPICSLENESDTPTCIACSHVLKTSLMPNHWRCNSDQCKGTAYVNAGDAGRCGLCGALKPAVVNGRPMGMTSTDVLRWD